MAVAAAAAAERERSTQHGAAKHATRLSKLSTWHGAAWRCLPPLGAVGWEGMHSWLCIGRGAGATLCPLTRALVVWPHFHSSVGLLCSNWIAAAASVRGKGAPY